MTTITIEREVLDEIVELFDSAITARFPHEILRDLRAALAAPATAPSQLQCVLAAWIPPEREGEFHHEHESITASRTPMAGWVPVYRHLPATAPTQPDTEVTVRHFRGLKSMENIDWTMHADLPPGTHKLYLHPPATAPAQPAWHDAPTCAGVWVNSISGRVNVVIEETLSAWQHSGARYYGPIPSDSGDRP